MTPSPTATLPASWIRIDLEIPIDAPVERVWSTLVDDIGSWWLPDYYATSAPHTMVFEAEPGGRVFEKAEDGSGLLWFLVTSVTPQKSLHLAGHLSPPFGGPATSQLYVVLEERDGGGTQLAITNTMFGAVDEESRSQVEAGWRALFADGLKRCAEAAAS